MTAALVLCFGAFIATAEVAAITESMTTTNTTTTSATAEVAAITESMTTTNTTTTSATTEVSTTTANTTTTTTTTTVGLAVSWVAGQNCDPATCRDGAACKPINATLTTNVDFDDCSYNKDKCLCWQHIYSSTGARSRMMVNYDESCCAIHNGYDCANPNGTAHTCVRAHKCFSVANSSEPCGDKVDANTCKCMKTCADTHDRSKCRVLPGDVRDTSCCAQRGLASCADGYTLSLGRKGCGGVKEDVLLVFFYYGTCCTPPACEGIRNEADCEDPCVWNDSGEDGEKCGAQTTPI